jgi:hypothetical protein
LSIVRLYGPDTLWHSITPTQLQHRLQDLRHDGRVHPVLAIGITYSMRSDGGIDDGGTGTVVIVTNVQACQGGTSTREPRLEARSSMFTHC